MKYSISFITNLVLLSTLVLIATVIQWDIYNDIYTIITNLIILRMQQHNMDGNALHLSIMIPDNVDWIIIDIRNSVITHTSYQIHINLNPIHD